MSLLKLTASDKHGQVSLESLLVWAAVMGVMGLIIPAVSTLLDSYVLKSHVDSFDSFSARVENGIEQLSFAAPGSRMRIPVPSFNGLSAELLHGVIYLDFDSPHFSAKKTREIHSPVSLSGTPSLDSAYWVLSRGVDEILIEPESESPQPVPI